MSEIDPAEELAALRQLLAVAEEALGEFPDEAKEINQEVLKRKILRAFVAVNEAELEIGREFRRRDPKCYWSVDVAHLVAVALHSGMDNESLDSYHPYSAAAVGTLAFAAACIAADHASSLVGDGDEDYLYVSSAKVAVAVIGEAEPEPPAHDKPAN